MRNALILSVGAVFFLIGSAFSEETQKPAPDSFETPFRQSLYSVSSDELDASESLNRVAGHIDLGFSGPSQSYDALPAHIRPGPFTRESSDLS